MANQNIEMSKLRQIIKHYTHRQGSRTISDLTGVSRNTVKKYIARFKQLQTPWDELSKLNDKDLEALFIEEPILADPPERELELYKFFPYAEKRLKQSGMTLKLLWQEYSLKYVDSFQITGFYKHFRIWKGRSHPSMHMVHKAGEKIFVDYTGKKLEVIDRYIKNQKDYKNISKKSLRIIHYQNKGLLTSNEKKTFSNKIRGVFERYCTFNRIEGAKNYLMEEYGGYTYNRVAKLLGISESTVKRSSKFKKTDFNEELEVLAIEIERIINSKLL